MTSARARVLFRIAAGPGRGFGHLMRCGALARAMRVKPVASLRASGSTSAVAAQLGWTIVGASPGALQQLAPTLLVIDDASSRAAGPWLRAARRRGIAVASIHDAGRGRIPSDLTIDGSLAPVPSSRRSDLHGPAFAILDPRLASRRFAPPRRSADVVVTLGGGRHVRNWGAAIARQVIALRPGTRIRLVQGFGPRPTGSLPGGCRWVRASRGVGRHLAAASVAVVAGGVTLYEAAALGTPIVGVAVVPAQRPAIRAGAAAGAAIDASHAVPARAIESVAASVVRLLNDPDAASALGARGRALIDGRGAIRVARALEALAPRRVVRTRGARRAA
jgi:hypothetical protein